MRSEVLPRRVIWRSRSHDEAKERTGASGAKDQIQASALEDQFPVHAKLEITPARH